MDFSYERKSHRMICNDPEIFVEWFGPPREQGDQFVLHLRSLKVGFQTARWWRDDKTRVEEDGTKVWSIGELLYEVSRANERRNGFVEHANVKKFVDEAAQNQALEVISQAMQAFDGNPERSEAGDARARVEFTPELLQKISDGEFLW